MREVPDAASLNNSAWGIVAWPTSDPEDVKIALDLAKKTVELEPQAGHYWNTVGVAHFRAGEWSEAIEALRKASELANGTQLAFNSFFLAMAHWQEGQKDAADKWFAAADLWTKKYGPQNEELRRFRSEAIQLLGRTETEAAVDQPVADDVAILALVVEAEPSAAWAHGQRGRAYAEQARWDEAVADLSRAVDLAPSRFYDWYQLALVHLGRGDAEQHGRTCSSMLEEFSFGADAGAAHFTAWTCALSPKAVSDFSGSVALAERAVASDPNSISYVGTLGAILFRAGRFQEAVAQLDRAAELVQTRAENDPSCPAYVWYFQAMAHHAVGNASAARACFDQAVSWTEDSLAEEVETPKVSWNRRATLKLLRDEVEKQQGAVEVSPSVRAQGASGLSAGASSL
jgi:tetratricopeptide (TPR) repeat protein